ncbi:MAG: hypothetical protein ACPGVZ_04040 [Myxococcota bacterium]
MSRIQSLDVPIEWSKTYLQRSMWVYQAVMRWKAREVPSLLVRPDRTKIVIEAFPRSSNSFCVRLFRGANPGYAIDEVSHHAHIISNVRHAAKWGIPSLVIVRDPVEAISSNMIVRGNTTDAMLEVLAVKYLDFYRWVEANPEAVVVAEFSDITKGRFKRVSERLNERFGSSFNTDFDEDDLASSVRAGIEKASPNKDDSSRIPIPSAEREARYAELRPHIRAHSALEEPIELYARLSEIVTRES